MDIPRTDFLKAQRKRRVVIAAGGALAVAGVAFAIAGLDPASVSADRKALVVGTVQRGEFVREVRGPGLLVPKEIRWIAAQAPGRIERVVLKPGAAVEPDSVIVQLTNPELERVVQEAEWAVTQSEAEVAALRLQLKGQVLDQKSRLAEARATYESTRLQAEAESEAARTHAVSQLQARRSQILAEQLAVRVEVEEDRLANLAEATQAQLRAQSARLEQSRNSLARQRQLLASLDVRAGMRGVLQALPVQVGQQLSAGAPIARVARPDELVAELKIPELSAKDLIAGQKARIDTRLGLVAGSVSRVDPAVENGAVRVEVELSGMLPAGARPDLSVDGIIELDRAAGALFVARPAAGEPDSKISVFRLDPDGSRAERVAATFGKASVNEIHVISGLEPGDRIIVSDTSKWSAYDELRIR
ncbi:MAG TPA: HlyD family efflux transporter periplasmic adaptor subunit [Steroidobacteraceae bacterium]|nr:HlyD family efflux transporter periplasmic adaptor subunit [Steroidobacteraceae bacterium]